MKYRVVYIIEKRTIQEHCFEVEADSMEEARDLGYELDPNDDSLNRTIDYAYGPMEWSSTGEL